MSKRYRVELTPEQRQELKDLISTGKPSNATNRHARILLKADGAPGGPQWTDEQISDALEVSVRTVARVRQAFVQSGMDRALHRQPRSDAQQSKMDGRAEAQLVALVCSAPPEGRARWTLQLLADRVVELTDLDSVSYETVRRVLNKTHSSRG